MLICIDKTDSERKREKKREKRKISFNNAYDISGKSIKVEGRDRHSKRRRKRKVSKRKGHTTHL